jgi:hypothetical protein
MLMSFLVANFVPQIEFLFGSCKISHHHDSGFLPKRTFAFKEKKEKLTTPQVRAKPQGNNNNNVKS